MKNIVLIGMPSAGKSTIGVILAKALGLSFIDTDLVIQEQTGRLLQTIMDSDGLLTFIKIEEESVLSITAQNTIIATGGSVVYSAMAMQALRANGTVIYLKLGLKTILQRMQNITTRGIAMEAGQTLESLYTYRQPLYETYADYEVDCDGLTVEETVDKIIKTMNKPSKS